MEDACQRHCRHAACVCLPRPVVKCHSREARARPMRPLTLTPALRPALAPRSSCTISVRAGAFPRAAAMCSGVCPSCVCGTRTHRRRTNNRSVHAAHRSIDAGERRCENLGRLWPCIGMHGCTARKAWRTPSCACGAALHVRLPPPPPPRHAAEKVAGGMTVVIPLDHLGMIALPHAPPSTKSPF